jgi:hypothetical protein
VKLSVPLTSGVLEEVAEVKVRGAEGEEVKKLIELLLSEG